MAGEAETDLEPIVTEHINPRDAVNDDVRAAMASLRGDEPPAPEVPEPAASPEAPAAVKGDHPTDPRRYADGTFKTAKTEAAPAVAAPVDPKLPATEEQAKASAAPSTAPAPPVSWAAEAKQAWASLPPVIQTAVLKREQEASAGFAQYSEKTKAYERALAPLAAESQRRGMTTEQGIQRLLDGNTFFEQRPAEAIMWLAQKHGLDLAELASNPPAPQMPVRSEATVLPQFAQHISSLEERLNGFLVDQNMSAVERFAADPKHEHYATVEDQLPEIMRNLQVTDSSLKGVPLLEKAYEHAVWLNPDIREKLVTDRLAQTQQAATAKVQAKATQSARAAVSIKGSSADTRPPAKPQMNGSGHPADDVRAAIAQLRAGI